MRAPPPRSDEARGQAGIVRGQGEANSADCAYGTAADQARKHDAERIACAALVGVELVRLADGTWLASKSAWGMFRPLATDDELDTWLRRVGAPV